ncbi:MAG: hypothetical protein KC619_35565, partial [Myxococcales bacterium]|nr:hypothetical protein [Myxococcales bacterium]
MPRLENLATLIRRRLVLRAMLGSTVTVAVMAGAFAVVLAIAWPWAPKWLPWTVVALGPLVGWWRARRAMPDDEAIVMFVDRRLDAGEAIVTAWEVGDDAPAFLVPTIEAAKRRLDEADPAVLRPSLGVSRAAWLPAALVFFAAAFLAPVPTGHGAGGGTSTQVRIENAEALTRIERLAREERDPARRHELDEIAREARELQRQLAQGMERREAEERLEELRHRLEATRRRQTADEQRARDAALEALAREPEMQRALEERDLESLDRSVERAAARREAADRERARDALRNAAAAARREGDEGLAQSLLQRERLLERRQEQAALARELAEALPELEGQRVSRALDRLARDGDGNQLTREMVDAMRD